MSSTFFTRGILFSENNSFQSHEHIKSFLIIFLDKGRNWEREVEFVGEVPYTTLWCFQQWPCVSTIPIDCAILSEWKESRGPQRHSQQQLKTLKKKANQGVPPLCHWGNWGTGRLSTGPGFLKCPSEVANRGAWEDSTACFIGQPRYFWSGFSVWNRVSSVWKSENVTYPPINSPNLLFDSKHWKGMTAAPYRVREP